MTIDIALKISLIVIGTLMLLWTIRSLARRILTESFGLLWGLLGIIAIFVGIFIHTVNLAQFISVRGFVLVMLGGVCILVGMMYLSRQISVLARRNQELAMQVSLLSREIQMATEQLEDLSRKIK